MKCYTGVHPFVVPRMWNLDTDHAQIDGQLQPSTQTGNTKPPLDPSSRKAPNALMECGYVSIAQAWGRVGWINTMDRCGFLFEVANLAIIFVFINFFYYPITILKSSYFTLTQCYGKGGSGGGGGQPHSPFPSKDFWIRPWMDLVSHLLNSVRSAKLVIWF